MNEIKSIIEDLILRKLLDSARDFILSSPTFLYDGKFFGKLLVDETLDGSKITSVNQELYNGIYTYDILPSGNTGDYWANGILVKSSLK